MIRPHFGTLQLNILTLLLLPLVTTHKILSYHVFTYLKLHNKIFHVLPASHARDRLLRVVFITVGELLDWLIVRFLRLGKDAVAVQIWEIESSLNIQQSFN